MARLERCCVQLLDRCELTNFSEPIVGDLLEERHRGRSLVWFLQEMLILLTRGVGRQIASDKLLSVKAIVIGLFISVPLRALMAQVNIVIGGGVLPLFLLTSAVFMIAGVAIRYKVPRHSVAMAAVFAGYALFAKASLIAMNFDRFRSASHPFHLPLAIATVTLPPLFAPAGAIAVRQGAAKQARASV